jgi:ribosome maturation protein SDO1
VLQISSVFTNVSKGEVSKTNDLQKAFGKTDVAEIVKEVISIQLFYYYFTKRVFCQILKKGEVQVGEKERDHDLSSLRKEIATLVAEKCEDPATQRPYAVGMIEKAMAEAGFSVKQNKSAKSQVCISVTPSKRLLRSPRSQNASSCYNRIRPSLSNALGCGFESHCQRQMVSVCGKKS